MTWGKDGPELGTVVYIHGLVILGFSHLHILHRLLHPSTFASPMT